MEDRGTNEGGWTERIDLRRRTSLATRLAIAILVVSVVTIVSTVVISSASVSTSSTDLLEVRADTRASTAVAELQSYFASLERGLQFLATSPGMIQLADDLGTAFRELDAQPQVGTSASREAITTFYGESYLPRLTEVRGEPVDPTSFVPTGGTATAVLQESYIALNPFDGTERRLLSDAGDDSRWTEIHATIHGPVRDITAQLGFLDLMIVDPRSESIVYSVNKDVAFATDLTSGPHSGSSLAGLVRRILDDPVAGVVAAADVAVYPPNLDNPTAFIGVPMYLDGRFVAVLVGSFAFDEVNRIMTQDWVDGRFGDSGEAYLVGRDRTMRSDSRVLIEDPGRYLATVDELGTVTGVDRNRMEVLDTSVLFQPVDNDAIQAGLAGEDGIFRVRNYLGVEVLSAVRSIEGATFDWILIVEQEASEAEAPLTEYVRSTLVITVVFIVALTFIAVAWSSGFMAPVRAMSAALRDIRTGSDTTEVPEDGAAEFRSLARHLGAMVESLRDRQREVLDALRSKAAIVRTLMPDTAAARVDLGERHLVDTVPQASITVVLIEGLDELVSSVGASDARSRLHELIDRLDATAESHGLDRVKVQGDAYYAACGLNELLIDHAPRSAEFGSQAIRAIEAVSGDLGVHLSARAGIASGSLATGLVGSTGLVFDIWGDPVDEAYDLAHASEPGQVLVGRSARDRIPASIELVETPVPSGTAWTYASDTEGTP